MIDGASIAIGLVLGGAAGCLLGYLAGRKPAPPADHRLEEELRGQLQQRENELAASRQQLAATAEAKAAAEAKHAAAERLLTESRESHEKALRELKESFKALSADALKESAPEFLRLAKETLGQFQESAKGDLKQRQEAIAGLVQPLKEHLDSYQKRLQESETLQSAALGAVKQQLEGLSQRSQALSSETSQLRLVLSNNQARGRWGEETLRRVVEAAGMSPHCDFIEQSQAEESKPDMIVRLPGGRMIIIDAKAPDLESFNAANADPARRPESLASHAAKLKGTIKALSDKNYPRQFPGALDYVVLFLPAESLFSAALEGDAELIVWASSRQIMLATPATLIALLRAVSMSWQQHSQSENAKEIAEAAQALFERVAKLMQHFAKIRDGLNSAAGAYDAAVGSYDRMVRPAGERLSRISGADTAKALPDITPLDASLRLPPGAAS